MRDRALFLYTWGEVRAIHAEHAAVTLSAYYLRTWRTDSASRDWKLIVECIPESR